MQGWSPGPKLGLEEAKPRRWTQTPCCYYLLSSYSTFPPKFALASPNWETSAIDLKLWWNAQNSLSSRSVIFWGSEIIRPTLLGVLGYQTFVASSCHAVLTSAITVPICLALTQRAGFSLRPQCLIDFFDYFLASWTWGDRQFHQFSEADWNRWVMSATAVLCGGKQWIKVGPQSGRFLAHVRLSVIHFTMCTCFYSQS